MVESSTTGEIKGEQYLIGYPLFQFGVGNIHINRKNNCSCSIKFGILEETLVV